MWRDLWYDVLHAVRDSRRRFAVAGVAIAMIGLGIGCGTAVFSMVYGMLLRPLPYADAGSIVRIGRVRAEQRGAGELSRSAFAELRDVTTSFEALAGFVPRTMSWMGPDGPTLLRGAAVSPALFPVLRATVHRGRLFADVEERKGMHRVAILSYRAWVRRFAENPEIIGAPIRLGGAQYTVVGVMERDFGFPDGNVEFWIPLVLWSSESDMNFLRVTFPVIGRLRSGVTETAARVEFRAIVQRSRAGRSGSDERVVSLQEETVAPYRSVLAVLSGAAALVVLIVSVNVAGLWSARAVERRRELAMCGVLGASTGRIVRKLLLESLLVSAAGGVVGVVICGVVLRATSVIFPDAVVRLVAEQSQWTTLAFAGVMAVGIGTVSGSIPAVQWARLSLVGALHGIGAQAVRGMRSSDSGAAQSVLVVVQVALAVTLLVGAGLLLRSFVDLVSVDPGYDASNVLTARISPPDIPSLHFDGITREELGFSFRRKSEFYSTAMEEIGRLQNLAVVESVGLSTRIPPLLRTGIAAPLRAVGSTAILPQAWVTEATPGYFAATRPHVRAGRVFTDRDTFGSPNVAIVSERLARSLPTPVVGQRLMVHPESPRPHTVEVVGVVADAAVLGRADEAPPVMYLSMLQPSMLSEPDEMFVSIRTAGDPTGLLPYLRAAVAAVDRRAVPDDVMTMAARLSATVTESRFYAVSSGFAAAVALGLAMCGLYGVLSRSVRRREHEFGVRRALGADRINIVWLVLRQSGMLVGAGVLVGLPAGVAAARVLESLLFGVGPLDVGTVVAAVGSVVVVALLASCAPLRRAIGVEPREILQREHL